MSITSEQSVRCGFALNEMQWMFQLVNVWNPEYKTASRLPRGPRVKARRVMNPYHATLLTPLNSITFIEDGSMHIPMVAGHLSAGHPSSCYLV